MENSPCNLLSVKIIQIKNLQKADLFSQSDCYVSLFLPTASSERAQTKVIKDCKVPKWNETFCFRIQNRVKNVLELMVHNGNSCLMDNQLLTVLFDVSKIQLGETVCLTFPLDPKVQEELEVEFSLESIPVPDEHIATNGVLVSREVSCLEVQVNGGKMKESKEEIFKFTVEGSFEESQDLLLGSDLHLVDPLVFHYIKYNKSALEIEHPRKSHVTGCSFSRENADEKVCLTLPLDSHHMEKKVTIAKFPPNGSSLALCSDREEVSSITESWVRALYWTEQILKCSTLTFHCCGHGLQSRPKDLDVRLGYELCLDEQILMKKRKKITASALKRVLAFKDDLQDHEVPVVAVMATGGGARAFTALHGHLFGLQNLGILDCITYISGSSGSTWALSNLYSHDDWSQQDLSGAIAEACRNMTRCKWDFLSVENLKEYSRALEQRRKEGYKTCITDLWGLFIDKALGNGKGSGTLSDQKRALSHGQNPLPIYMVLNTRDKYSLPEFKEWMEFTPFEVGLLKYGAYVGSEHFGSKFFMGRLMKKVPESQICFMKGMWSNVFSYNLLDFWRALDTSEESFWQRYTQDRIKDIERPPQLPGSHELNTHLVIPACKPAKALREVITQRLTTSEFNNFLNGLQLNNGYLDNKNFYMWKDTMLDTLPNQLTTASEYLSLADTALYIDSSYPPLMRPERRVNVILHLNYSSGSQTATLDEASRYFSKQGIPFPRVDMGDVKDKDLKECYVFEDPSNLEAPIVVFFPLINDTFRKYKAPGVERSPTELKQGEVDVTSPFSPYGLECFQYKEEDFDKLVELTSYNIQNNKCLILQALQHAVERKRCQKKH
ncbi:cytosolic phospholipase A2 epsilon-like [Varanus komodoensis]|uniref:cytosolic phospholipase A2 epsilon-like n=1 Tax=Varanus komodoensis TaxID=61221 RepID=UPI001CF7E94A|nr:cytosolic phospholipase A2 epsilon-like [Varanus komodoensis]